MTSSNEQHDKTGAGTVIVALLTLVGIALMPAVIGWTKPLLGY